MDPAQFIIAAVLAYAGAGAIFAMAFITFGLGRIDPAAANAPWTFRLLVFPASAALWPFLAVRWLSAGSGANSR